MLTCYSVWNYVLHNPRYIRTVIRGLNSLSNFSNGSLDQGNGLGCFLKKKKEAFLGSQSPSYIESLAMDYHSGGKMFFFLSV